MSFKDLCDELDDLFQEGDITAKSSRYAQKLYCEFARKSPQLPAPSTLATSKKGVQLYWENDPHYLEIEIFNNEVEEIFYRNTETVQVIFLTLDYDPSSECIDSYLNLF
jgi:hypothetical protein